MKRTVHHAWRWLSVLTIGVLVLAACASPTATPATSNATGGTTEAHVDEDHADEDVMPALSPVTLDGRKLRVVATTNLVGETVAEVAGEHIELSTLLAPGTDPHAYQLAPADRQLLENADVIFINGLGLEEGMLPVLEGLEGGVPVVPVSVGIVTREFGEDGEEHDHEDEEHEGEDHEEEAHTEEGHHHEGADPHVWQSVPNVIVWTHNIADALATLDPDNAEAYANAASDYTATLEALNTELHALVDEIPAEQRKIVTDHDSLGYLADEYGFTIVGTVIPSLSTSASASAQELAALSDQIEAEGVRAIFVGTTVNPQLAEQLAQDLGIQVVSIYTDSLSDAEGPTPTYVDFMRYNLQTIVNALR